MPGAFLTGNAVARGVVLASPCAMPATMPLSNLLDGQPRMRARFPLPWADAAGWDATTAALLGLSGGAATRNLYVPLRADLGAARPIDCVAVIGSTLGAGTKMRVRLATVDATGNAGDAWDSGLLTVPTGAAAAGNLVVVRSTPATGRYLLLEVYETGAATVDLGRIVAGLLWRMTRSHSYGIEEGRLMLDRRERNSFTGAEFPVPAVANPRSARFTLPMLSAAEALGAHRTLLAELGAAGDTLWIPSTDLAPAELALRSIWGAAAAPGDVAAAAKHHRGLYSRSFNLVERL